MAIRLLSLFSDDLSHMGDHCFCFAWHDVLANLSEVYSSLENTYEHKEKPEWVGSLMLSMA